MVRGCFGSGTETLSHGTSRSQWCLDNSPPQAQAKEGPSENTAERQKGGVSHLTSVCPDATSAAAEAGRHLPPGEEMAQGQRTTNVLLYPGRDPLASFFIKKGDCSCWIVRGAALGLRNVPVKGAKIYLLSSPQAHLLKNLTHTSHYPSRLSSRLLFFLFLFLFFNLLAHEQRYLAWRRMEPLYCSPFPPLSPVFEFVICMTIISIAIETAALGKWDLQFSKRKELERTPENSWSSLYHRQVHS